MKNAITYVLAATIILAFSGLADGSGLNTGGQQKKKKGPPNTTRTNGSNNGGQNNNGKTNRKNARKPTNGGQNNNGKTNGANNGGNNNNGQTNNKPTQKKKGGGNNNNGQTNNKPTQKKKKQPSLSELLGLKGEVAKKFETLLKRHRETVKKITESDMSNEDKAVKIKVSWRKYRDAIEELLNEEQLAKLQMIHLKRAQSSSQNNKHPHIGQFVAKALTLTEEQIKQLAAARQLANEKRYKVLTNKNLSEEEKKAAIKEINEQVQARTAEILTDEQLAMLKEIYAQVRKMSGHNSKKTSAGNPES